MVVHKSYRFVNKPKKEKKCDYPEPYLTNCRKARDKLKEEKPNG